MLDHMKQDPNAASFSDQFRRFSVPAAHAQSLEDELGVVLQYICDAQTSCSLQGRRRARVLLRVCVQLLKCGWRYRGVKSGGLDLVEGFWGWACGAQCFGCFDKKFLSSCVADGLGCWECSSGRGLGPRILCIFGRGNRTLRKLHAGIS